MDIVFFLGKVRTCCMQIRIDENNGDVSIVHSTDFFMSSKYDIWTILCGQFITSNIISTAF